jgi:hypothetical protein
MTQVAYTKKALVQRIVKHVTNSRLRSDQFAPSDNEIILLIDQSSATRMIGQVYNNAKVEGALAVPEAYLTTFALPALQQDPLNFYWFTILPQPPVSLPLGYSVIRVYSKDAYYGQLQDAYFIKAKRVGRRLKMQMQPGVRAWIENSILWLAAHDGTSLYQTNWWAQMSTTRTVDINAVMNLPEDDIEFIFDDVVKKLLQRYGVPQDVVLDGLPSGNKSS